MTDDKKKCVLCGGDTFLVLEEGRDTRFGIEDIYSIAKCKLCDLIQIYPFPSDAKLKSLYESHYNFSNTGHKNKFCTGVRKAFLDSVLYDLWLRIDGDIAFHSKQGEGRLLDVGCNEGRGLKIYQKHGFSVEGLELNEVAATRAKSEGFRVSTDDLEKFIPESFYDVVVLSNVLEHSTEAEKMVHHVKRILKPGRQIWISCSHVDSWQRHVFGRYWVNWHKPFHIYHFSIHTLKCLLQKEEFEILTVKIKSPTLWLAHSTIITWFSKPGQPTLKLRSPFWILFLMLLGRGLFFPFLWAGNRLGIGDCLIVTAKKRTDT